MLVELYRVLVKLGAQRRSGELEDGESSSLMEVEGLMNDEGECVGWRLSGVFSVYKTGASMLPSGTPLDRK